METLKRITKYLFLFGIACAVFRSGNFYNSFIPKPYEIVFVVVVVLTLTLIFFRKRGIICAIDAIPREILIASIVLVFAILLGWIVGGVLGGIPNTFNMILEFGTFSIGLSTFLLILFYSDDDPAFSWYALCALLLPALYAFFIVFKGLTPDNFLLADGNFIGFTANVNTIAKILLVPSIFFFAKSLFEYKTLWKKITYGLVSALLVGMLFWIASRGALLSMAVGLIILWGMNSFWPFSVKKSLINMCFLLTIVGFGFALAPHGRQRVVVDRLLNVDSRQSTYIALEKQSILQIIWGSKYFRKPATSMSSEGVNYQTSESRLSIWKYYLKIIAVNPFGIGPNTHLESHFKDRDGNVLSSGTHNTYLQIWLWGGILALYAFVFLLYTVLRTAWSSFVLTRNVSSAAIFVIVLALMVAIAFDDSLALYQFWIALAIALRAKNHD